MAQTRRQRRAIGRGRQRSDVENDAEELSLTETVVEPYDFDTPDVAEVHQGETGAPDRAIPVDVVNPVRVDELPARTGGIFSRQVPTNGHRLLNGDPRRKVATIIPISGDLRIGDTQAGALNDGAGAVIPQSVPFLYSCSDELWAAGVVATVEVSVIVEQWAR